MKNESAIIELYNITKLYKMGQMNVPALKNISFSINIGEYVSIMGPSGSGKSTLMNIIGCLDKPTEGRYLLNEISVSDMNEDQLAEVRNKSIGFVFQTFNLLPNDTALLNVELPLLYAGVSAFSRIETANQALKSVNLSHRSKHRPSEMSGGERQRVAIARALVNNPQIILADEPTGNLDSKTGIDIMNIFQKLHEKGKTIILVTHDLNVGMHAHRLIHIKDGMIESDEEVKQ